MRYSRVQTFLGMKMIYNANCALKTFVVFIFVTIRVAFTCLLKNETDEELAGQGDLSEILSSTIFKIKS